MIQITDKEKCCGCEACAQACPKNCISMKRDAEGFLYPVADEDVCINCGLCEKVCPVLNPYDVKLVEKVYAMINHNENTRKVSSSGGVFTLLVEEILSKGGVVFGARFDEKWQVLIDSAETMEEARRFQGSKYLQARVGDSYARCKKYLEEGREVLFSGVPCQIAGLKHFLRKLYPNLLAVEVVCHGAPSPVVWRKYLSEAATHIDSVQEIHYDTKSNKIELIYPHNKNAYMKAYLSDLISRPSCYACPAKNGRSQADLTLADFWGIGQVIPSMDDNKGTSMVVVHSKKGMDSLPLDKMMYKESDESALKYNVSYLQSAMPHSKRQDFFESFEVSDDLHQLIDKTLRPSIRQQVAALKNPIKFTKTMVHNILRPIHNSVPNLNGGVFI